MPKKTQGKKTRIKFYAVAVGQIPGVYQSWNECQAQVTGYKGAKFKSFPTQSQAEVFVQENCLKRTAAMTSTETTTRENSQSNINSSCGTAAVNTTEQEQQQQIHSNLKPKRRRKFIDVHFDGGARGNPGLGGAGAQVIEQTETGVQAASHPKGRTVTIHHIRSYCGPRVTNNQAEYQGLLAALQHVQSLLLDQPKDKTLIEAAAAAAAGNSDDDDDSYHTHLSIKGDSDLIIQQLKGLYQVKSPKLVPLYQQVKSILTRIQPFVDVIGYQHVYRKDNTIADRLANEAMDERRSWTTTTTIERDEADESLSSSSSSSCGSTAGTNHHRNANNNNNNNNNNNIDATLLSSLPGVNV